MGKEYKNRIQNHTYSIPSLVHDSVDSVFAECLEKLKPLGTSDIQKIVITGCGYSYAAALAIRDYLADVTELPVHVCPAIEASRFSHDASGDFAGTLLIAISNSGEVSRLIEAALVYKNHGASVVALTGNHQSPIAMHADYVIDISSPWIGSGLPLRGYAMTILALAGIGYRFADNIKKASIINSDLVFLKQSMDEFGKILQDVDHACLSYLERNPQIKNFEFVGSGYERGAAFLGKIEMLGQAGVMALDEDCEQWCHCNFFMASPERIGSILFCSKHSPGASRSNEVLSYMIHLRRPVCVVTDDPEITDNGYATVIHVPEITNLNAGFIEMAVPSFLTGYYCDQIGETYSRGFRDQWEVFKTGSGTCESTIIVD